MDNNKLKLEEGEYICSECEGRGSHPSNQNPNTMASMCRKCQGAGKLDWIENIVGKPPISSGSSSSSSASMSSGRPSIQGIDGSSFISKEDLDFMSKQIADSIDNEILESIRSVLEQKTNKIKAAANVFKKIGGLIFDNRIIS